MKEERYHLVLDDFEQGVVIRALNDLRTDLISDKRETDAVDDGNQQKLLQDRSC